MMMESSPFFSHFGGHSPFGQHQQQHHQHHQQHQQRQPQQSSPQSVSDRNNHYQGQTQPSVQRQAYLSHTNHTDRASHANHANHSNRANNTSNTNHVSHASNTNNTNAHLINERSHNAFRQQSLQHHHQHHHQQQQPQQNVHRHSQPSQPSTHHHHQQQRVSEPEDAFRAHTTTMTLLRANSNGHGDGGESRDIHHVDSDIVLPKFLVGPTVSSPSSSAELVSMVEQLQAEVRSLQRSNRALASRLEDMSADHASQMKQMRQMMDHMKEHLSFLESSSTNSPVHEGYDGSLRGSLASSTESSGPSSPVGTAPKPRAASMPESVPILAPSGVNHGQSAAPHHRTYASFAAATASQNSSPHQHQHQHGHQQHQHQHGHQHQHQPQHPRQHPQQHPQQHPHAHSHPHPHQHQHNGARPVSSDVSESELVSLTRKVLQTQGSVPVGKLGSLLHRAANNHNLPAMLKERFGGLKKFLMTHSQDFVLSDDHPYNPHVSLADDSATSSAHSSPTMTGANTVGSARRTRRNRQRSGPHHIH